MEDLGAKEQAEVAAANHKPEMSRDRQPRQKRQKQVNEQAGPSSSNPKKRGRKPKLSPDEKHKNKIKSDRKYRKNKTAKTVELQKKNQELGEENEALKKKMEEQQLEINKLKEQLPEIIDQADKLAREVSDQSENLKAMKMVNQVQETAMQPLQETILNQGDQEHNAENSDLYIPWDEKYLENLEGMPDFSEFLNFTFSETKGGPSSIAKAISPLHETVNVKGFLVPKENSDIIQEIVSNFPNTASGIQFRHPASRNGFINTLAEVYKMVKREEMLNPEEINHMENGVEDLKCAGFEISWLEDMVVGKRLKRRKKLESQRTS